jgi:hypothetical protein
MESMVLERLEAWVRNPANQASPHQAQQPPATRLPSSILFYRDGVSESQFQQCLNYEVKAIENAFKTLASNHGKPDAKLRLTFVVVGKRHYTRFYPKAASESHGGHSINGNVQPGLLVEDVITTPHAYNFYLQSHAASAGTARSAHYHVLLDGMGFGSNNHRLANIRNTFCYCFPRALKAVSYIGPAYLADRLCERGRVWLRHWKPDRNFQLPLSNHGLPWDLASIMTWKAAKALELSRTTRMSITNTERVCTHYNDNTALGSVRLNPWHPNLDHTMFWM